MKTTKKLLILVLSLVLVLALFAGCTSKKEAEKTEEPVKTEEKKSETQEETKTEEMMIEPVTFTAFTTHSLTNTPEWGEDPISAIILEKTGVTLDIEYTVEDFNTKVGLMLSAGDYPDLLLSVNNDNVAQYAEAGALVVLEDYIDEYGVNIKQIFGEKVGAMKSESDGHIYGFNREFGQISANAPINMQVQIAMLKEFGYPEITYLSELTDLMAKYIEMYPQFDGQDTVGLLSPANGWTLNITFNNAALRTSGFQDDGNYFIDPETLTSQLGITTQGAKEYFAWVNDLYQKGLFDIDSFNLDLATGNEKLASGRVLAISAPQWFTGEGKAALRNAGLDDRLYAEIPLFINEEAKNNSRTHFYDPMGSWKSVITNNCEDPIRAFQFMDMMWSEEMQVLCNWGIEDTNYTVIDGMRVMNEDELVAYTSDEFYRQNTGVLLYNYWLSGDFVKDSSGQFINPFQVPEALRAGYTQSEKDALAAYDPDAQIWSDLFPDPEPSEWGYAWKLTLPTDTEGAIAEVTVFEEIRADAIYNMVIAETEEDFNAVWDEFLANCEKTGIAKREAEIDAALRTRMELWYD